MKKLFIITGEHSGDLHASFIVKELKSIMPDLTIEAVGGKHLETEGVKLFSDHSKMAVVGLDAIKSIFSHIKLGKSIYNYLKDEYKPDLVLLIDYGGFNLRLAPELKKAGMNVYYYISPQVWATRKNRLKTIKKYIDKMMLILPFEEKIHKKAGVNAEYVGHPLISQLDRSFDKEEFIKVNELDPYKKIIGIFPGSRKMEINYLLPVFLNAARIIQQHAMKTQFCIGQASNIDDKLITKYLDELNKDRLLDIKIIKNQNHALLSSADAAILASGTITLEAAIYKTPMVVSYKGPHIAYWIYLMLRYIKHISLPNIIAEREIVKEFVQDNAKPELIANEVLSLLHNKQKNDEMTENLSAIQELLGDKIASKEAAKIIFNTLNSISSEPNT